MFESILSSTTTDTAFSMGASMLSICVAVILGLIIGVGYMSACKKEGCSKNFIVGLVVLPVIVSIIILLIGSNIARAFSMGGAFALVRFRSAPGSAKDIAVVFFAMATGLACGMGYIVFAILFVAIILVVFITLSLTSFGEPNEGTKQLRITIPENLNYTDAFGDLFQKYTVKQELRKAKTTNMGTMFELTYYVNLKKEVNEKDFIDDIRMRNGNLNISVGVIENTTGALN